LIETHHENIKGEIEKLLLTISQETELIEQDNLARGEIVISAGADSKDKGPFGWRFNVSELETPVSSSDPPEYWGNLGNYTIGDFVSATEQYPWMPEKISEEQLPF
jgi:hypothetical protein